MLGVLVKGAVVMTEDQFVDVLSVSWELLLQTNQELAASAAALFILASVRAPTHASQLMLRALHHHDPAVRINAILRYHTFTSNVKLLKVQFNTKFECFAHHYFCSLSPVYCSVFPLPLFYKNLFLKNCPIYNASLCYTRSLSVFLL